MSDASPFQKKHARMAVKNAIRSGSLIRPKRCQRCKKQGQKAKDGRSTIQAHHHKGYDYPLDVEWLCIPCHLVADPRSGEDNGRAKLTEDQVREIRSRYRIPETKIGIKYYGTSPNSLRGLAKEFGVHSTAIKLITDGINWSHTQKREMKP